MLLDTEFVDAMQHGLVIVCPDGRRRCFYPRIFTYSADYPEKYDFLCSFSNYTDFRTSRVLICGVRNNGARPCHRCLIEKGDIHKLGAPSDTERQDLGRCAIQHTQAVAEARAEITAGYAVDGSRVEDILKGRSLVPTQVCCPPGAVCSLLTYPLRDFHG